MMFNTLSATALSLALLWQQASSNADATSAEVSLVQVRILSQPPKPERKPIQPERLWNPACIGIIGGVGPEASADVVEKTVNTAGAKDWHYQARDVPSIYLLSSPKLDGTTQNAWNHLTSDEQLAVIGNVLDELKSQFPACVREYGAFGLACNTIHQYLYNATNEADDFVSLINAVNISFIKHGRTPCKESNSCTKATVYILGSAVTMSDAGEYRRLFDEYDVNPGDIDDATLWRDVILKVQSNQLELASENFYKYLKDNKIPKDVPVSLSCTELPLAAAHDKEKYKTYDFIDPNQALADELVDRTYDRAMKKAPEKFQGWKNGVQAFKKTCCKNDEDHKCDECCKDFDCTSAAA